MSRANKRYAAFARINGRHPFRRAVPGGFVDYGARRRRDGRVVYFNFRLAREMGLIPANHPDQLTRELGQAILDTFSLTIINEYDLEKGTRFPAKDVLDRRYFATRYLQLQHPGWRDDSSGDGRSIWNGSFKSGGKIWDVTSCGTGVTRLCPATAEQGEFFQTGNWATDYGCGTATVEEGLVSALMSEAFHASGVATERVLAVIELSKGFAINVRAGLNLLRPSHFFIYLKQGDAERLKGAVDLFLERQVANGRMPDLNGSRRYERLAEEMARTFARTAATFEREYVFCWLDWDGDNILAEGGIIDYGSVRQFGLFHREYRFDDGPRMSTTIVEQRKKARHIVQCFAQIREFLKTGRKPPLRTLARDPILALFDEEFSRVKEHLLLRNIGYELSTAEALRKGGARELRRFRSAHAYFERARSARGPVEVADGITWNAIFSSRDLLRELPLQMLEKGGPIPSDEFLSIGLSTYASPRDRKPTPHRRRMAGIFQRSYLRLVELAAEKSGRSVPLVLADLAHRSAIINRYDRITGDSVLYAAKKLTRARRRLGPAGVYNVIQQFVYHQARVPEQRPATAPKSGATAKRVFDGILDLLAQHRHGL